MGRTWRTQMFSGLENTFGVVGSDFFNKFGFNFIFSFGNFIWVFVWDCILGVFWSILGCFFRLNDENSRENRSDSCEFPAKSVVLGSITCKCQFLAGDSYSEFIEQPQTMRFIVHELFLQTDHESLIRKEESPFSNLQVFSSVSGEETSVNKEFEAFPFSNSRVFGSKSGELIREESSNNKEFEDLPFKNSQVLSSESSKLIREESSFHKKFEDSPFNSSQVFSLESGDLIQEGSSVNREFGDLPFSNVQVFSSKSDELFRVESSVSNEFEDLPFSNGQAFSSKSCELIHVKSSINSENFSQQNEHSNSEDSSNLEYDLVGKHECCDQIEVNSANKHEFDSDFWQVLCDMNSSEGLEPKTPVGIGEKRVDYDEDSPRSLLDDPFDENMSQDNDLKYIEYEPQLQSSTLLEERVFGREVGDRKNEHDQVDTVHEGMKECGDTKLRKNESMHSDCAGPVEDMPQESDSKYTKYEPQLQSSTSLEEHVFEQEVSYSKDEQHGLDTVCKSMKECGEIELRKNETMHSDSASLVEDMPQENDLKYIEYETHEEHLFELSDSKNEHDQVDIVYEGTKECGETKLQKNEHETEQDVLLEQKDLIRQMKKEMRQMKSIKGLPTILEEAELPRMDEHWKPLILNETIGYKDRMDEIQAFYKCYLEKTRKLDVWSHQTLYAIGLIQLKNRDQTKKPSVPTVKSLLAQNLLPQKLRKNESDPLQKFLRDLRRDLEFVYVSQLCVSWEILKWQLVKANELKANDPDGFHQYGLVAAEFQQFRVLVERFIEDELFHRGPRFQSFVTSRCVLPSLLQVPFIKDMRSETMTNREGAISVAMLVEIIEESMQAYWEFVHADKDAVNVTSLMGIHGVKVDLLDPSDAELLMEVLSILQKKERKLKDLIRSRNCIVKKFQKHRDHRLKGETFLAQVELRLVSRVLSISRPSTEQLQWCLKKLNKINIVGRKVHIEPSFLLFPC